MRRKAKSIINGVVIGAGFTALLDIIAQWTEQLKEGNEFSWQNYDGWQTIRNAAIGGAIGGGIAFSSYYFKLSEEAKLPFNTDRYLKKVLADQYLKTNPVLFESVVAYRKKIKQWMLETFGNKLVACPEEVGSFFKRTAIGSNYDLDFVLPFKKYSHSSLKEMYYNVYDEVNTSFGSTSIVTRQTKSIGITFENYGNPIHFDVVPGREINNYELEKELNLYVDLDWLGQSVGSFKMNVEIQKCITTNRPEARQVIKLLKVYRDKNNLILPSVIIEQCVVTALSENNFGICTSIFENLMNCMYFISKKLEHKNLIDFANTNNNLNDKLSDFQRGYISNLLQEDLMKIVKNPRYMNEIFEC